MTFEQELSVYIKARSPVIYLVSPEEERVELILKRIADDEGGGGKNKKRLLVWASTTGFVEDGKVVSPGSADVTEAFKLLTDEVKAGAKTKALFVMKDLHRFMEPQDRTTYRLIRDAAKVLELSNATLILLSPVLQYPKELEKVLTVMDVPFPDREELKATMEEVVGGAGLPMPPNGDLDTVMRAAAGLTVNEFKGIVSKSLIKHRAVLPGLVASEKEQVIRKSGVVDFYQSLEGLEDVGGLENLKEWIADAALALTPKAQAFGLKLPRGLMLAGVTGCGKTLSVKAAAGHMKVPLLIADAAKILGQYVGMSERNLAQVFKTAEDVSPCILLIDEAEKFIQSGTQGDSGVSSRLLGQTLTWMNDCRKPVLVCLTANDPLRIPIEVVNRCAATFFVDLPNEEERQAVWRVQVKKVGRDPQGFDLKALSEASDGWSGREMESIINEALKRCFKAGTELSTEAIVSVLAGRQSLSVQRRADIEKMRTWGKDTAVPASRAEAKRENRRELEFQ